MALLRPYLPLLFLLALAACASPLGSAPVSPSDLQVRPGPGYVELSWQDNSQGEAGFRVYRQALGPDGAALAPFEMLTTLEPDTESYRDLAVETGASYLYAVTALSSSGTESNRLAAEAPAEPQPPIRPTAPSNVRALAGPGYIELLWQDNSENELGFSLYRQVEGDTFVRLGNVAADETRYLDRDVSQNEAYRYAVAALGSPDESERVSSSEAVSPEAPGPESYRLVIRRDGNGSGVVISEPEGIACGADGLNCTADFATGTLVNLRATAETGSVFVGWRGACSDAEASCTLKMQQDYTATVIFGEDTSRLRVLKTGPAEGRVISVSPPGIDCGDDCQERFPTGTVVGLSASPAEGARFAGWGAPCEAIPAGETCLITLERNLDIEAHFTLPPPSIERFESRTRNLLRGESTVLSWEVSGPGEISLRLEPGGRDVTGLDALEVSPTETTDYILVAESPFGEVRSETVRITVGDAPVISSLSLSESLLEPGEPVIVRWEASGPEPLSLTLRYGDERRDVTGEEGATISFAESGSYRITLEAANVFASVSESRDVRVGLAPSITNFSAADTTVTPGSSVALSWSVMGDGDITLRLISADGERIVSGTGTTVTAPAVGDYSYTLIASSDFGSARASLDLSVGNAPGIDSFSATPGTILRGDPVILAWDVTGTGVISLTLDPGALDVSGQSDQLVYPVSTTDYTLRARNSFGESTAEVRVSVTDAYTLTIVLEEAGGSDRVVTIPPSSGINCGSDCSESYAAGEVVGLSAIGDEFEEWQGCDTVRGSRCFVAMTRDRTVRAIFDD